jgi:DNA polymerase III delta prime subunit
VVERLIQRLRFLTKDRHGDYAKFLKQLETLSALNKKTQDFIKAKINQNMALQFTEQEVQEMAEGSFFYGVGMKKGVKEKAQETARKMLLDGMSAIKVAGYTDLSVEDVERIQRGLK